jgi:MFS family permease
VAMVSRRVRLPRLHGVDPDPRTAHNFRVDAAAAGLFAVFQALTAPFIAVVAVRRGAAPWEVGVLTAAPCAAMLLSGWYARLAEGRRLVPWVAWTTGLARLALLVTAWAPGMAAYILSYLAFNFLTASSNPAYTAIERAIYREPHRGQLMAGVRSVLGLGQFVATLVAGWLMDRLGPGPVFSVAVAFGLGSAAVFARMRPPEPGAALPRGPAADRASAWDLVRRDPQLGRLILAMMLGGGGNLLVQPGYPLYQVHRLHLDNGHVAWLTAAWALAWTVCYPLWGRLCDRRRPAESLAAGFACYLIPPLCYALGGGMPALLLAAWLQGVGDSAVDAGWQNHIMRIAGERTGAYAGAYFTFLGLRGTAGPLLGAALVSRWGLLPLFLSGLGLIALGLGVARRLPDAPPARAPAGVGTGSDRRFPTGLAGRRAPGEPPPAGSQAPGA